MSRVSWRRGLVGWLAWVLPENVPAAAFFVPQVVGGYFVALRLQGRRFDAHIVSGGTKASRWVGAGIGLAALTPVIGRHGRICLVQRINPDAYVDMQYSVDMGHDQHVYYSHGATEDDARRLAKPCRRKATSTEPSPPMC